MNLRMDKLFMILLVSSFTGTSVFAEGTSKKEMISVTVSSADAYKMVRLNKKNTNFLLLDVRTPAEFQEERIQGAVNIDFHAADFAGKLKALDKSKKILVYCRSGNRSGKTLPVMKELGFKEVYNMNGGLIEWEADGYPLERP